MKNFKGIKICIYSRWVPLIDILNGALHSTEGEREQRRSQGRGWKLNFLCLVFNIQTVNIQFSDINIQYSNLNINIQISIFNIQPSIFILF